MSNTPGGIFYNDSVLGIDILRATREPCIVCGHPTGDCSSSESKHDNIAFATQVIHSMIDSQKILVEETVYENRQITPYTVTRVVIARKGSYITVAHAKEIGII